MEANYIKEKFRKIKQISENNLYVQSLSKDRSWYLAGLHSLSEIIN
jgi:hypothetical protein